jgi:ABC-type transport system involved in multi-copper enzyme maturation permease subunit
MPGVGTVYRWELFKLRHQKRTYIGLGAAIIVPILFVLAIHLRHHHDRGGGFAFSDYLDRSGLAVPLVILLFGAVWMFPLITALVAGDIFASEDHNGTLKTIFTRSPARRWRPAPTRWSRSSCAAPWRSSPAASSRASIRYRACRGRSSRRPRGWSSST